MLGSGFTPAFTLEALAATTFCVTVSAVAAAGAGTDGFVAFGAAGVVGGGAGVSVFTGGGVAQGYGL